jgi:hypothetical protein
VVCERTHWLEGGDVAISRSAGQLVVLKAAVVVAGVLLLLLCWCCLRCHTSSLCVGCRAFQIFGGFCRSSALRGKFARVLLTSHPHDNPHTEVEFDQFVSNSSDDADGGDGNKNNDKKNNQKSRDSGAWKRACAWARGSWRWRKWWLWRWWWGGDGVGGDVDANDPMRARVLTTTPQ